MSEIPDFKRRSFLIGRFSEGVQPESLAVAIIDPSCFAFRGVACMSCRDVCPTGAVRFDLALGGARPRIITDTCTGCGDCTRACPADAIQVKAREAMS
jgi:ferredoxin-type protein NapF